MPQPYKVHYRASITFSQAGISKSIQVFPWQFVFLSQSLDFLCMVILFDLIAYLKIAAKKLYVAFALQVSPIIEKFYHYCNTESTAGREK